MNERQLPTLRSGARNGRFSGDARGAIPWWNPNRRSNIPLRMNESNPLRRSIRRMVADLEQDIDRLREVVSDPVSDKRIRLLASAGYRNSSRLRVSGRVVRYAPSLEASGSTLENLRAMWAIYNSHEVPGAPIACDVGGEEHRTTTTRRGTSVSTCRFRYCFRRRSNGRRRS
jgi:hypothetical protein